MTIPLRELFPLIGETILAAFRQPQYLFLLAAVFLLIHTQHQRLARAEAALLGAVRTKPLAMTLAAFAAGTAGGVLASFLFLAVGVSLPVDSVVHLWLVAFLLMWFHPRFLCFAYGGGLVALSSLLFGFPRVDPAALMALVAILHLVEAVLIMATGDRTAMPVFVRRPGGRLVGGFTMQRLWPAPFLALVFMPGFFTEEAVRLAAPDWWPLIPPSADLAGGPVILLLLPVMAVLGYGDLAVTDSPARKAKWTAGNLLLYSGVLLVLAILAAQHRFWAFAAALFSPLAHEWVIQSGRRREMSGPALMDPRAGAVVLDVAPGGPAAAMGLRRGDVIREVNGEAVASREEVEAALWPWALEVEIVAENRLEGGRPRRLRHKGRVPPLGVIWLPSAPAHAIVDLERPGPLLRLGRRLARRWRSRAG